MNLNLGFKPTSFNLVLGALAQNTFILPCHSMHHIVHCIDRVFSVFAGNCPLSIDVTPMMRSLTLTKTQCYLQKCQASKTPLFIPIKSHSLAPALLYCIRTTSIQLLHAAVDEPLFLCMTCHCHSK